MPGQGIQAMRILKEKILRIVCIEEVSIIENSINDRNNERWLIILRDEILLSKEKKKIAKSIEKQLDNNFILICIKYDEQW